MDQSRPSIGRGPNAEGQRGFFERPNIVGYLERNGPPPDIGAHVTIEHVRNWLSSDRRRGVRKTRPLAHVAV